MDKHEELRLLTLEAAKDYKEHGHSEEILRRCREQQEHYDMCNQARREMLDKWKRRM